MITSDSPVLSRFVASLKGRLPVGSQIMGPGFSEATLGATGWTPTVDMWAYDVRSPGSNPHYGETWGFEHLDNIHVRWGP